MGEAKLRRLHSVPLSNVPIVGQGTRHIAVLTPCMDHLPIEFYASMEGLRCHLFSPKRPPRLGELVLYTYSSSLLVQSRHRLVNAALKMGLTHLLWIDSDMSFPVDIVDRLIMRDEPIIAANCMARRTPWYNNARYADLTEVQTTDDKTGLEEVHRAGFGVIWISAEVFRQVPKPWFATPYLPELDDYKGEDYFFCERAREVGFKIYVDHDLSKLVQHHGSFGYHPLLKQGLASLGTTGPDGQVLGPKESPFEQPSPLDQP